MLAENRLRFGAEVMLSLAAGLGGHPQTLSEFGPSAAYPVIPHYPNVHPHLRTLVVYGLSIEHPL